MRWALLGVLVWTVAALGARADEGVVLHEGGAPRPGLCAALRIQLTGVAPVECLTAPEQVPLSERIAASAATLRARGARLGVLLERDPDPGLLRMYIVAARDDQAVVSIERIEDRPEPDVDRSLALKVSDAYEVMAIVQEAAPERAVPAAAALQPRAAHAAQAARWQPLLELGGGPHLESEQTRWLANILLGVGIARETVRIELAAGVRLDTQADLREAAARVHMRERGGLLSARLLWRRARFELGGVLEGLLSHVSAEAVARGRSGEVSFVTPVLSLGADVRVRMFGTAYLRFAPTLELLTHERLTLEGVPVLGTGPMRAALPLSLLVHLPL